ncbi:HEAT repeat domain-containing protein [Actinoallomurus vinaceus]
MTMLSVAGADTWIGLDRAFRTDALTYGGDGVTTLKDERLLALVAACSRDGRRREAALASAVFRTEGFLLPALVLRTADWVPQVREQAWRSLAAALRAADGPALVAAAGVAVAMGSWARGDRALETLMAALRSAPVETLAAARAHRDLGLRRAAYGAWLESGRGRHQEVMDAALSEPDPVCRVRCAERLVTEAVRDERPDVLERLLEEGSAKVRVEALTALVKIGRPQAGAAHLADRSAMMRATAQWAVRRTGREPAALYRQALTADSEPGRTRALVTGLGECGTLHDVEVLLPFLGHPSPRVRAEAVRAVRRLGGSRTRIAGMLADPAPVVVRAAYAALHTEPDAVPAAQLWEWLSADAPRHVRLGAYELLRALDTWTRVHVDLHLLAARDVGLGDRAHADLLAWLRGDAATAYRMPPEEVRLRLEPLIAAAEPVVGGEQARRLRWHLGIG